MPRTRARYRRNPLCSSRSRRATARIWPVASSSPTRTSASDPPNSPAIARWRGWTKHARTTTQTDGSTQGWGVHDVDDYLGSRADDYDTPFGKFFNPEIAPLPSHVLEALQ